MFTANSILVLLKLEAFLMICKSVRNKEILKGGKKAQVRLIKEIIGGQNMIMKGRQQGVKMVMDHLEETIIKGEEAKVYLDRLQEDVIDLREIVIIVEVIIHITDHLVGIGNPIEEDLPTDLHRDTGTKNKEQYYNSLIISQYC